MVVIKMGPLESPSNERDGETEFNLFFLKKGLN